MTANVVCQKCVQKNNTVYVIVQNFIDINMGACGHTGTPGLAQGRIERHKVPLFLMGTVF